MAFDPIQEDCIRLILSAMRREGIKPLENPELIERGAVAYRTDPSSMIVTDADRSFHLVAQATETIDYRIPFLTDERQADAEAERAEGNLREAAELDPANFDARRMLAALQSPSDDAYVEYLVAGLPEVEGACAKAASTGDIAYDHAFAQDLAHRPYLRWLAALAEHLLICGRYGSALEIVGKSLAHAPLDPAGIRHTGMLALAKLEAAQDELDAYRKRHAAAYAIEAPARSLLFGRGPRKGSDEDAWTLLARMNLAYRSFDETGATAALDALLDTYPHAAEALYYQAEFPEGIFGRVHVEPRSEDELILAISEATPLFQEGIGSPDATSFALWVAEHEHVRRALTAVDAVSGARGQEGGN